MAKTVEQRIKDLVEPTTRCFVAKNWADIAASHAELSAPIFKKLGDIGGAGKRYDSAADKFIDAAKKKEDARALFHDGAVKIEKISKELAGVRKELEEVQKDEAASLDVNKEWKKVEDGLEDWEEQLKGQQDINKMRKVIFDRWMKLTEDSTKSRAETIAAVKKAVAAAQAAMASSNNEMNTLEAQIRAMVINYQKTALDMNKKDIADDVRGIITCFGR